MLPESWSLLYLPALEAVGLVAVVGTVWWMIRNHRRTTGFTPEGQALMDEIERHSEAR